MTRNGKIARLSPYCRDQLNARLENGEEGESLLAWLNGLPKVQEILQDHFAGAPITKQNLSDWRLGGFRDWQLSREWIGQARQLAESAQDMEQGVDTSLLPGMLVGVLAARYAALLNSWDGEPDPKFQEKVLLLRELNGDIALLQKTMHQADRQQRELEQGRREHEEWELEKEKTEQAAPIMAQLDTDAMEAALGGGELARAQARILACCKHNVPLPANMYNELLAMKARRDQLRRAQSKPVAPQSKSSKKSKKGQTHSKQVQPVQNECAPDRPSRTESNPVAPVAPDSAEVEAVDAAAEFDNHRV